MPQPTVQLHILYRRIIARVCTSCRFRTLIGPRNTIKNNSIVSPLQKWIFSYKAINNRTEATEVGNFRKIMKSLGGEKSFGGEKSLCGEKSMGRNQWGETFRMERNLSIGEKPFDWSQLKFLCYWHYEECWIQFSCNNCIHHFKTKFVLIHHRMPQHAENITLVITEFITLTQSLFLWIMEWPNMQKTVLL